MKKIYIAILMLGLVVAQSSAQNLDSFLEGGTQNANTLLEGYLNPAFVGFGYALNSGWYNTGKPHKLLGFDITFGPSLAMVPSSAGYFKFNPADYNNVTLEPSLSGISSNKLPTMFGPNLNADDIPVLVFNGGTVDEIKVTAPTGLGLDEVIPFNAVPAAYAQVGIGLIKNTELKIRLLPEQSTDDYSAKMFGLGVMHDVKQWIPGIKNLPFDLSGFFAFNTMTTAVVIDSDLNQSVEFNVKGTTLQGIISKKLLFLTVYGGLGVITSKTDFSMLGDYEVSSGTTFTDPINFESKNSGMRANVGARLKILILTISAEYAIQEYNTLTAGVGISIR